MNKNLGTKWFTFYTKIRPWLSCVYAFASIVDFLRYPDVYMDNLWLILCFFTGIAQTILNIVIFVKSKGNYVDFVRFVKGVLLFESFSVVYGQGVAQYLLYRDLVSVLFVTVILFLLSYFVWYKLNVKYFERRISYLISGDASHFTQIKICGTCGEKLINNSKFCHKCGKEIDEIKDKYAVCIFDAENKFLRKETREIDITKLPPSKYATNDTYYAIERIKAGKKVRIYYEKNAWNKQMENSLQTNE